MANMANDSDMEIGSTQRSVQLQFTEISNSSIQTQLINNNSSGDAVDSPTKADFYDLVCNDLMRLGVEREDFAKLVKRKREVLLLGQRTAEIRVATELFIKKCTSSSTAALLAITSTSSCHQQQALTIVSQLLEVGADVSKTDADLKSALHHAVGKGYRSIAAKLLEHEASPLQRDSDGLTPISFALANGDDLMSALLLKHMARRDIERLFLHRRSGGNRYCLQQLLESGIMRESVKVILDSMRESGDSVCDEGSTIYYSLLESDREGATPTDESFNGGDMSSLQVISRLGDQEFVCHPAVTHLINRKWRLFARKRFMYGALGYLMMMLLMTVAVVLSLEKEDPSKYSSQEFSDILRAMCELLTVAIALHTIVHEVVEVVRFRWRYFKDPYNYFDLSSAILLIAVIPLRFAPPTPSKSQWPVYSMAYLLSVLRTLKYAAVIRRFRTYIRIIFKMVTMEFGEFILLFFLTALAFTGSFSLALREHGLLSSFNQTQASGFGYVFVSALRTVVETGPAIEYYNNQGDVFGGYCTFLMILYLAVVMLMLLNILIAQLTDVYDSIRRGAEIEAQITRAWIVSRVELNLFHTFLFHREQPRIIHYTDREVTCSTPLSPDQVSSRALSRNTSQVHGESETLSQLADLNTAIRMIGQQLLCQQKHLEELLLCKESPESNPEGSGSELET